MASVKTGLHSPQSLIKLRVMAVKTLAQVYHTKDTLDESVTQILTTGSAKTYQEFDRSWLFEVCSGVLRYRGRLDYIIDTYSLKKKPTGVLRRFLQTGVFQLLAQEVPSALVVSETVQAIKASEGDAPSKFANAILRKVADQREEWKNWKVTERSPFDEQVAWCSLPEWLFKKLRKERGSEWLFRFSEASLERPKVWYRTENESFVLEEGYQGNEPQGFVQDISNQSLVTEVVKKIQTQFADKKVKILDLCSAPGGKSLGLAYAGYSVIATDIDVDRLAKVKENSTRLKLENKIEVSPHQKIWESNEIFDVIWIDAPCSSLGIMRRHPEIKWNRTEEDIDKIRLKQTELLEWATTHVSDSGLVIYSTCSVLKSENEPQVSGLKRELALEWGPGIGQNGDGIHALFLLKSSV